MQHDNLDNNTILKSILENGEYDEIKPLKDVMFAVKKDNCWGVINGKKGASVIACEYSHIQYSDDNYVLLCKDDLWGAKSIDFFGLFVNVPVEYDEIKPLNKGLFGVKKEDKYGIINSLGSIVLLFDSYDCNFVYYNENRILATKNGKHGFMSLSNVVTIPFRYDEIIEREDGSFDVRIKRAWGVLGMMGKEIVQVKYSRQIPTLWKYLRVKDVYTGRFGILSATGSELVPAIYDDVETDTYGATDLWNGVHHPERSGDTDDEYGDVFYENCSDRIKCDYIYFAYTGIVTHEISHEKRWGCMDSQGNILVDAKYFDFNAGKDWIVAENKTINIPRNVHYNTYDLFNSKGELIIGGFTEFHEVDGLLLFRFGGFWREHWEECDSLGNYYEEPICKDISFIGKNCSWLTLDMDLNVVSPDGNTCQYSFEKGDRIDYEKRSIRPFGEKIPDNIFSKTKPDNWPK